MASPTFAPEELLAHVHWVRRLATTLVSGAADAEEVSQETWRVALEHPPRHAGNLRHWLALAARNVARKLALRERRHREPLAPLVPLAPDDFAPPAAELVERAELQRLVVGAVLALEEPYRSTLLQRFFDELAPGAIAARTGVPVDTVKTRLKRGLEQLRRDLGRELEGRGRSWQGALAPLLRVGAPPPVDSLIATPRVAAGSAVVVGGLLMSKTIKLAVTGVVVAAIAAVTLTIRDDKGRGTEASAPNSTPAGSSAAVETAEAAPTPEPVRVTDPTLSAPAIEVSPEMARADVPASVDARVFGVVRDHRGVTVPDATVVLGRLCDGDAPTRESFLQRSGGVRRAPPRADEQHPIATTDPEGRFEFSSVSSFSCYELGARHFDRGVAFRSDVAPRAGESLEVDLVLDRGVALFGRVLRSDGGPAQEIELHVFAFLDGMPLESGKGRAIGWLDADDDGTFRTIALPYRLFEVIAEEEGKGREREHEDTSSGILEAPADASELRADITLRRLARLRGRIVIAGGDRADLAALVAEESFVSAATKSLTIHVSSNDKLAVIASDMPPEALLAAEGTTGPRPRKVRGRFDLDAGEYEIELEKPGLTHLALLLGHRVLAEAAVPVDLGRAPDLVVDLARLPPAIARTAVSIRVVSSIDGTAIGDLVVQAALSVDQSAGVFESTVMLPVPASGRVDARLYSGRCILTASKKGLISDSLRVELQPEPAGSPRRVELELALSPIAGPLRGEVIDAEGAPFARATISVHRLDAGGAARVNVAATARDDGHFELAAVPAGGLAIVATAPDHAPAWAVLDSLPDDGRVRLVGAPAQRVALVAVDDSSRPLDDVRWEVRIETGVPIVDEREMAAPALSSARVHHLPAGSLTIRAHATNREVGERHVVHRWEPTSDVPSIEVELGRKR